MFKWTAWETKGNNTPYFDWWTIIYPDLDKDLDDPLDLNDFNALTVANVAMNFRMAGFAIKFWQDSTSALKVPIPVHAKNPDDIESSKFDPSELPDIPNDSIIVAVIDSGIPLGHRRFRDADGESRILAAWQQGATFKGQRFLPFGRELYKGDIDRILKENSGDDLLGHLDEDAFNRATGVIDLFNPRGHREAAGRFSHGAHVLDTAAGEDPVTGSEDFLKRVKIIVVNFPDRYTFGFSGEFLDNFMIAAIERISTLSRAIWHKNNPHSVEGTPEKPIGYPTLLNISFGRQAGAKDASDMFPQILSTLKEATAKSGYAPLEVVMPVGNDNLLRGNANIGLKKSESKSLIWRVLPEDQSSNYVEIWSDYYERGCDDTHHTVPNPIEINVVPPAHRKGKCVGVAATGKHGQIRTLETLSGKKVGRLYCEILLSEVDKKHYYRIRYVICIAPTLEQDEERPPAPSGDWRIMLCNSGESFTRLNLMVQTDQSILPTSATGLRSYFDDDCYDRYDETGRVIDSYEYPTVGKPVNLDTLKNCAIRRHRTMNASASHKHVARIAAYRQSDGQPAPYSATSRGKADGSDEGTEGWPPSAMAKRPPSSVGYPTAALPTEEGPAHRGLLGAGASDGSVVAMSGTSFASAQATRCLVEGWLAYGHTMTSEDDRLGNLAEKHEQDDMDARATMKLPFHAGLAEKPKIGTGRIRKPLVARVNRTGR